MAKRYVFRTAPHSKLTDHGPKVPDDQVIGPFPGNNKPQRTGPYKVESPNTPGRKLWAYWNGRAWGKMGSNFRRVIERKDRASHWQNQPWYGIKAPQSAK